MILRAMIAGAYVPSRFKHSGLVKGGVVGGGGPTKDCPWSSRLGFSVGLVTPPQSMGLYSGELIIGKICASEI